MSELALVMEKQTHLNLCGSSSYLADMMNPSAYAGLYGFHKYWGKKPAEPLRFLVNVLSESGGTVCDPFLGSGIIAKEATELGRKFIGGDLNPFSIKLSKFISSPCSMKSYKQEIKRIENEVRHKIESSYGVHAQNSVSHILWCNGEMQQVWERQNGKRTRLQRQPDSRDYELYDEYKDHIDIGTRSLVMFDNSRINTKKTLQWNDIFTGRALRNIKILKESIARSSDKTRQALELTLTSSIGQMSKMVFAITSRGKNSGQNSSKIEVGSWVIGYWRPETHFEINVWNCFESKAIKLSKGLPQDIIHTNFSEPDIRHSDALELLMSIPDESIDLLITDPPHGDRIPYFELSELWNATLGISSDMESEIVVSNAKGRNKGVDKYDKRMSNILMESSLKLKDGGAIALFFNSRKEAEWNYIKDVCEMANVEFVGAFPMNYSAQSVVQDNRKGSMKSDYVLIFSKGTLKETKLEILQSVPGWFDASPFQGINQ